MDNNFLQFRGGGKQPALNKKVEVTEITETLSSGQGDVSGILNDLVKHAKFFRNLDEFCNTYLVMPSFLFEKESLDWVLDMLRNSSSLYSEAQSFMYLTHTYEILKYNETSGSVADRFIKAINMTINSGVKNELLDSKGQAPTLRLTASDNDTGDIAEVFSKNRVLLGLFIYSLVSVIIRDTEVMLEKS